MKTHLIKTFLILLFVFIFSCNKKISWEITVSEVIKNHKLYAVQNVYSSGEDYIKPDEGKEILIIKLKIKNLLETENSYRGEDIYLTDSSKNKYENLGIIRVKDGKVFCYLVKLVDPTKVNPSKVSQIHCAFIIPKSHKEILLKFPNSLPVRIDQSPFWIAH